MKTINKIASYITNSVIIFSAILILLLTGCQQSNQTTTANKNKETQIWSRLRSNNAISKQAKQKKADTHQNVQKFVAEFSNSEEKLHYISKQASPYLYYIIEQLEKRNMPAELALLPMIESNFQPQATSNRGAAGLWQFIPGTGRQYGLLQNAWYDGRRDVKASTEAALDYLKYLHEEFDNDWMLALAAYNAGEGTVHRAIDRNQKAGKPTHFAALRLPKETQLYVPKFLALAEVISNPEKHAVSLPAIENKPYFAPVNINKQLTFTQIAKLADLNLNEIKRLNAGFRKSTVHPKGSQELLLPIENIQKFEYNLTKQLSSRKKGAVLVKHK